MSKFGDKEVRCPLCGDAEPVELGTGNGEASFGCDRCEVAFLIDTEYERQEIGDSVEERMIAERF